LVVDLEDKLRSSVFLLIGIFLLLGLCVLLFGDNVDVCTVSDERCVLKGPSCFLILFDPFQGLSLAFFGIEV
jgi:hypothetical protein